MTLCLHTRTPTHKVRSLEDAVPDVGKLVPAPVSVQIQLECPDVDGLLDSKQYLNFSSNHPIEHKISVVRTLHHRATHVVSEEEDRKKEIDHVNSALVKCGYPKWALERGAATATKKDKNRDTDEKDNTSKCQVGLPYVRGLSEQLRKVFRK